MPNLLTQKNFAPLVIALCLASVSSVALAEKGTLESAREYLSDPPRVGSLAGTIIGGALTAHPAGVVVGSVIGFFVGKQSMFKREETLAPQYSRRSIIPLDAIAQEPPQMLALNSPLSPEIKPEVKEDMAVLPLVVSDSAPVLQVPVEESPLASPDVPLEKPVSALQKIAAYCYRDHSEDVSLDPQLQVMCYYHQSAG